MALQPGDILMSLPDGVAPEAVLAFRADYGSNHPLRLPDARPADLAALRVPQDLAARLRRWSLYFEHQRDYESAWSAGAPAEWWLSERDALPREIASLVGRSFAVRVAGGFVHSAQPAKSEEAAAALTRLILLSETKAARSNEVESDGTSFAFIAGHKPPAD